MRIACQIFASSKVSRIAGYLYAFEPLAILSTCAILPDSLQVAFLLAMTTVLLEYKREPRWGRLVCASLWLAVSAYVKPSSYYLPLFLAAFLLVVPREVRFSQRLKASTAFVLLCMSLLAIWQIRNSTVSGYRGFSSIAETNLYYYLAAGVQANMQHRSFLEVQSDLGYNDEMKYLARNPDQLAWTRAQRLAFMKHEAIHTIASRPMLYAQLHAIGMGVVLFSPPATDFLRLINMYPEHGGLLGKVVDVGPLRTLGWILVHRPAVLFTMVLMFVVLMAYYACALKGLVRSNGDGKGLLLWIALYFVLISGGPQSVSRYRLSLTPFVCVLGAAGIAARTKTGLAGDGIN
jgi:4-amino-4-deoxy-L-arabinose transferase-like glycosyltransferase